MAQREWLRFKAVRFLNDLRVALDYLIWRATCHDRFKRMPTIESVIVVASRSLGDLLVSTPVFRALKKAFGRVDVLVKEGMQDVLKGNPYITRVVTTVDQNYDLGVVLRTYNNDHVCELLRPRCQFLVGCTRTGFRESTGRYLNQKAKPTFGIKHRIEDNLDVIRSIGIDGDPQIDAYTTYVPPLKGYVVFHTDGSIPTHRWELSRWIDLTCKIQRLIVFSGTDEAYVNEILRSIPKPVIKATGTTIGEYFGWIKHALALVTVDTSAMHVAAAFGTPTVALFGAGDPRIWRPWLKKSELVMRGNCHSCRQRYCRLKNHRCMTSIGVDDVYERLCTVLQDKVGTVTL